MKIVAEIDGNPPGVVSSGGKLVNVIFSSSGTIKDPSSNDPQYVGSIVNKMQMVSTSMPVGDFIRAVHVSFNLDPRKRYKVYSRVYVTHWVSVFVDISYSSTLADLVVNDPNGLNSVFRYCTEEIVGDEGPPTSDGNITTNGSRC
ncbi:uncharacterized protein LOC113300022 [Papaver somniferum]|uniref:uncharacterized protein LOC113300022 n=1 Tax=Papaver somniferum TaxID=3469 RepID=UPI000E6F65AF|nr:uncharacterized protein LOC113300022 [Papaver somniferum]